MQNRFTKARLLDKRFQSEPPQAPRVDIYMKEMFNIWDAHVIFDKIMPKLEHENDGIIFTVDAAPYYMGECSHILKWKPEELNTIDFTAIPLTKQIQNDGINIWSLHTKGIEEGKLGSLFDFICMSKEED